MSESSRNSLEVRDKAMRLFKEALSHNNEYGFGEKIEAQDKALQRVSMFIAMSGREPDLKEFWEKVKQELLYNI